MLGNKVDAEDAVGQALLQFWNSRASIDPAMNFRRLLFAITKRVAYISKRELHRRRPTLSTLPPRGLR
jgi:DNA-directed RNA polymerase specialized sigma24 family protein